MPKLDSGIYGADDNACAHAIAADALDTETPGVNIADYWGQTLDQGDQSRSAKDTLRLAETATVKALNVGKGNDGKGTKGNHGKQG